MSSWDNKGGGGSYGITLLSDLFPLTFPLLLSLISHYLNTNILHRVTLNSSHQKEASLNLLIVKETFWNTEAYTHCYVMLYKQTCTYCVKLQAKAMGIFSPFRQKNTSVQSSAILDKLLHSMISLVNLNNHTIFFLKPFIFYYLLLNLFNHTQWKSVFMYIFIYVSKV